MLESGSFAFTLPYLFVIWFLMLCSGVDTARPWSRLGMRLPTTWRIRFTSVMSSFPTLFDWQVDATEEFGLARRFSIHSFPTVILFAEVPLLLTLYCIGKVLLLRWFSYCDRYWGFRPQPVHYCMWDLRNRYKTREANDVPPMPNMLVVLYEVSFGEYSDGIEVLEQGESLPVRAPFVHLYLPVHHRSDLWCLLHSADAGDLLRIQWWGKWRVVRKTGWRGGGRARSGGEEWGGGREEPGGREEYAGDGEEHARREEHCGGEECPGDGEEYVGWVTCLITEQIQWLDD